MKKFFATALLGLFVFGLLFVGMMDFMSGCGESWVDARGNRIFGECMGRDLFWHVLSVMLFK